MILIFCFSLVSIFTKSFTFQKYLMQKDLKVHAVMKGKEPCLKNPTMATWQCLGLAHFGVTFK